jgi:peptidoglycan/xylan/chitin deacetylase (PgdA/CDA1 family)
VNALKRLLLATLTGRRVSRVWAPFMRGRGTIFMLHRFTDPELGTSGHDPALLRAALAYLRRERYDLVSLTELFRRLSEATPTLDRAIAFTIDDGYMDQATVAGEIFADFDCPVTTFVTTGFLDGKLWFWWDQIEYVFRHTERPVVEVDLNAVPLHYRRDAATGYGEAQADFTERCKQVPEREKLAGIRRLAREAEVELPRTPPMGYAPMSWNHARALEQRGMTFGPHTVTHPVLARATADQSRDEIEHSWRRLQTETTRPVPIFCYPNGQPSDYGDREIAFLRTLGFAGAVVGTNGYAESQAIAANPEELFRVQRFGYPNDPRAFRQCASGLERVNQLVRGEA